MSLNARRGMKSFPLVFVLLVLIAAMALAQEAAKKGIAGVEADKLQVIQATDGYLIGPHNDTKYFIFGTVKLHKPGTPEEEWSEPGFYLEVDGEGRTFSASFHYYFENRTPIALREVQGWTKDVELDMVFTRDGNLDPVRSSIALKPPGVSRNITVLEVVGFYKKGNSSELFVPRYNKEGKIVNLEARGEPIYENRSVNVAQVCYEYSLSDGNYYRPTGLCPVYKILSISRSISNVIVALPYTPVGEVERYPSKVDTGKLKPTPPPPVLPEHLRPPPKNLSEEKISPYEGPPTTVPKIRKTDKPEKTPVNETFPRVAEGPYPPPVKGKE